MASEERGALEQRNIERACLTCQVHAQHCTSASSRLNTELRARPLLLWRKRRACKALARFAFWQNRIEQLGALGKHKTGKVCLYIKRLADVDAKVLRAIIDGSVRAMAAKRVRA